MRDMAEDLSDYRKSYEKGELIETNVDENPLQQFRSWFYQVIEFGGVEEANAMTVSTIGLDGYPKSRVVLLKKCDEDGFTFYSFPTRRSALLFRIAWIESRFDP